MRKHALMKPWASWDWKVQFKVVEGSNSALNDRRSPQLSESGNGDCRRGAT